MEKEVKKKFRDFTSTRKFARSLNLKSGREWNEYCKSGEKPLDIPRNPNTFYKTNGWISWGDFLGTGTIATSKKQYRSFDEVKKFARSLNLKSGREWNEYCKSGEKPLDIPRNPQYYKKEWNGWGDFLSTGRVASHLRKYRSFEDAREFVQSLKLNGQKEWKEYCKSGEKPDDIPAQPSSVYEYDEWVGMGDWLGTGRVRKKQWRSFEDAKKFVRGLKLNGIREWKVYCKSGEKPEDIPTNPTSYKKDWVNWGDFLGTGTVATQNKEYRPYKEAREFVRKLNLKGQKDWLEYCTSGNKPDDIPSTPWLVYKEWGKK